MLTVAYCRVSTDEQAEDGYSIDGQAEKLRTYAEFHELGELVVVSDPGWSGKNTDRPGLERLRGMVAAGHVAHVLVWRLDRLSRNLGDLILLADEFGEADVALHSFTEKLDLSSATGRMFYNVLGAFAQFYREQLAENVKMGTDRARGEGRWTNRPPTGYDLVNGFLVPNEDAVKVRKAFRMAAEGASRSEIADGTRLTYSTARSLLLNRAYIGEMRHKKEWVPGVHDPLVTIEEFDAAQRSRTPGRKRGKDLMSGRVVCGVCSRKMSIESNGQGQKHYRCKHRGSGCKMPARSNRGLVDAALLGMSLLCDSELRAAIRAHLTAASTPANGRRRAEAGAATRLRKLRDQRGKLLALHYDGKISADQFGEEQARITAEIELIEDELNLEAARKSESDDLLEQFETVAALLETIDLNALWDEATDTERRVLLDELLQDVTIQPDGLVVNIHGAPPLRVDFAEVGLKDSQIDRVGGPYRDNSEWRLVM